MADALALSATVLVLLSLSFVAGQRVLMAVCLVLAFAALLVCRPHKVVGLGALVCLIPLVLVPVQRVTSIGPAQTGAMFITALVCLIVLMKGRRLTLAPGLRLPLLAYVIGMFIATAISPDPPAWNKFSAHVLFMTAGLVLGSSLKRGERMTMVRGILTIGILEGLFAVYEFVTQRSPLWVTGENENTLLRSELFLGQDKAIGTLGHSLPLALILLVSLAFALDRQIVQRLLPRLIIVGVLIAALAATSSRSAIAAAFVVMLLHAAQGRGWSVKVGIAAFLSLILLWAVGFFESGAVDRLQASGSLTHRGGALAAIPNLLDQGLQEVLIGNGFNAIPRLFAEGLLQSDGFASVDNQVVTMFATGGLVALLCAVAFGWHALRSGAPFHLANFCTLFMFAIFEVLLWPSCLMLWGVLLGAGVASRREGGLLTTNAKERA